MTVGDGKVRYSVCCLCNLSVTGDCRGDGNTGVAASTEIVPVMCLQGPSFLEMSESAGPRMGTMGYSLSSKLLGSAIATTMSVSQNFPKDGCLGLCFLKYWQFPVVTKLNHELLVCIDCVTLLVPLWLKGPEPPRPPYNAFSELFDC